MARVVALVEDLMFGSRVQEVLRAGGHEVVLVLSEDQARGELAGGDVLVVDLMIEGLDPAALLRALNERGLAGVRALGIYAHTEPGVRSRALEAGFAVVVPRSRMVRDGAQLVAEI